MRQFVVLFLSLGALAVYGQNPADKPETTANKRIELAKQELDRVTDLVDSGALPRLRLEQAQQDLEDVQDEAVLDRTLFSDVPEGGSISDQDSDEMIAAAQRRVERQQARLDQAAKLVNQGLEAQNSLTALQEELEARRANLTLAHSRANLISEMAALARYRKAADEIHESTKMAFHDSFTGAMEHYEGTGRFRESRDLKPLEAAFAKMFERPLPISAEGESEVHRALGLDHRGRVDVALSPSAPEGIWLLGYLKARRIPYYAFTRAIPGKATAAHIHIGPGSPRLHNTAAAD